MSTLISIFVVLHLLSWAVALGLTVGGMRTGRLTRGVTHSVLAALVTGILIVGFIEMNDGDVNHFKIGVKLAITLIVTGLAFWADRKQDRVSVGVLGGLAGLIALNVAIAVIW